MASLIKMKILNRSKHYVTVNKGVFLNNSFLDFFYGSKLMHNLLKLYDQLIKLFFF